MSGGEPNTVVIDAGSWTTKAGFAGDNEPKGAIPTLVGTDAQSGTIRAGLAAQTDYDKLEVRWPLQEDCLKSDDLENLWNDVFTGVLKTDSATCNVLISDATTNTVSNREKMAQLMFETFQVPKLYIAKQSVLGMYSIGRFTALVVDSGHVSTHVVPVYEGFCVSDCIEKIPIGGKAISEYIAKALQDKGVKFSSKSFQVFEAAKIKESMCNVAGSANDDITTVADKEYTLPDGTKISVGKESTEAAELLFKPQLADPTTEQQPLPNVIQSCIGKCENDMRADLKSAITLIGGTSVMTGYPERVSKETTALLGGKVKIISNPKRDQFAWIGGSVLASLPQTDWVTSAEYDDKGCAAVRKCP